MKSWFGLVLLFAIVFPLVGCQSAAPPDASAEAAVPEAGGQAKVETVTVDASALNMRSEPSLDGEILAQIKRGEQVELLESGESWMKVRLPDGRTAWAASRFLLRDGERPSRRRRSGCPADSDFAIVSAPTLTFSDSDRSGTVVVEAHVGANGVVRSTRVITNSTGDEELAAQAERELASARFSAPVVDCKPREFIYTYRRDF